MIQRQNLDRKYLGTVFDRQVRIDLWDQDKLRQQTILILGIGGLGSVILMNILRLGVKKVIIVDYDVVDIHNLNRQIMYGLEDIGKAKVDCAIKNSKHHNIGNTQIVGHAIDAVKNWSTIIQLAKQSNVVFNCVDYGDKYDIAVASLCMTLKIPLILGGTFATMFTIDYINPEGKPCFLCLGDQTSIQQQFIQKLKPNTILQYQSLQFLPKNNNPTGRSSMVVCLTCGELMVSHFINYLFLSQDRPYKTMRLVGYHNTFQIVCFDLVTNKKCTYCGDPNYIQPIPTINDKQNANPIDNKPQTQKKQVENKSQKIDTQIQQK